MRKKLLAGLLCLCMVATFLPGTAGAVDTEEPTTPAAGHDTQQAADVASVKSGETTTYYETIEAAWTAATDEGVTAATVTLLKDVTLASAEGLFLGDYSKTEDNHIINFKGEAFTLSAHDSAEGATAPRCISVGSGTLNVESGTISSPCLGIEVLGGTVNIKGGTVQTVGTDTLVVHAALDCAGGETNISGTAEIKSAYSCISVRDNTATGKKPTVNISGGIIETTGDNAPFGLDCSGGMITISDNAVIRSNRVGLAVSGTGEVKVEGGTVSCVNGNEDSVGVEVQHGKLTVTGGTIGDANCGCGVLMTVVRTRNEFLSGDAVISGGTIKGKHSGLQTTNHSEVTINSSANIAATDGFGVMIAALDTWDDGSSVSLPEKNLTINGGTMTGAGEFSGGLYVAGKKPIIQGGTFVGGIRIDDGDDITLSDLLKEGSAYFKEDNTQIAASELTGNELAETVTVKTAKKETNLTITASVATEAVPEIPVAIAEGDEAPGDTPTATKKVVTLTVNGPSEVLDRVTVTCDAELTLTKVANATSKWTCDLPEGAEANKPYTFTASFAGDETWAAASTKCIVLGDGTVKDCSNGHTWDEGVQTKAPTATEPGEKTFTCTVCGATKKEVIPATGGTTPDPTPSTPSGGGSYTPPSNTTTETTKNPDGSTTTKTENKTTGTVTETTKNPDGSTTKVETKKDGTVTTTQTDATGDKTETVERPDGSSVTKVDQKNGTKATVNTDTEGKVEAEVTLPKQVVAAAQEGSSAIMLPVPRVEAAASSEAAPVVTVKTGSDEPVKVLIPTTEGKPGTVAVIVNEDGSEEIVKTSVSTEDGLAVSLPDGATVKIVDNSKSFNDVPASNWAADAVSFSAARELFSGTSESTFSPDEPMTRAMMVTVLARFDGADTSGGSTWYEQGVEWAVSKGISDGSNPDSNISREQLAVMLWRYAGSPAPTGNLDQFDDAGSVSGYAQDAMRWAVENGIVNGNGAGSLLPQGNATRAQVAQMLKNFISMQ